LIFVRTPFGFSRWAAHQEPARRTPAELEASDLTPLSGFGTAEQFGPGGGWGVNAGLALASDQNRGQEEAEPTIARHARHCACPPNPSCPGFYPNVTTALAGRVLAHLFFWWASNCSSK